MSPATMSEFKDCFLKWFTHNAKANKQFIEVLECENDLPDKAADIFSHILNSHLIWLKRIHRLENITVPDPWDTQSTTDFTKTNKRCFELTEWFLQAERYGMSLQKTITYQNTSGREFQNSISEVYFHILSHSAYHRGQIGKLFRRANIDPPVTDFIFHIRNLRMEGAVT